METQFLNNYQRQKDGKFIVALPFKDSVLSLRASRDLAMKRFLQRIFWRDHPNNSLDVYELQTITYGTASASYLVIRCMLQSVAISRRI